MNERVRELAEQANLITHKVPNGLAHLHTLKDLEEFAESIIRKCIQLCDQVDMVGADDCIDNIKEHFEIEK